MENRLQSVYRDLLINENTLGIFLIDNRKETNPAMKDFDYILVVAAKEGSSNWSVEHYDFHGESAAIYLIEDDRLHAEAKKAANSHIVEWILGGDVIFERNKYSAGLKQELLEFPAEITEQKLAAEFARLVQTYKEAKRLYQAGFFLDASTAISQTLHYLARLSLIEEGHYPGMQVWEQVKETDLEVYKLYEEFTISGESLDQRINLMIIGIEFALTRRAESCARHLIKVMKGKGNLWSIGELASHSETASYADELSAMVEYLAGKEILEVVKDPTADAGITRRLYTIKKTGRSFL